MPLIVIIVSAQSVGGEVVQAPRYAGHRVRVVSPLLHQRECAGVVTEGHPGPGGRAFVAIPVRVRRVSLGESAKHGAHRKVLQPVAVALGVESEPAAGVLHAKLGSPDGQCQLVQSAALWVAFAGSKAFDAVLGTAGTRGTGFGKPWEEDPAGLLPD